MDTQTAIEQNKTPALAKQLFNKVPEVTIYFWVIKVLCTTVGETFSDFLDGKFNLGTANLAYIFGGLLLIVLFFQFKKKKYVPGIYWLAVVLVSVVGTLITDNLTDNLGISLVTTTIAFSIILAITFAIWYAVEKTLSIESIDTWGREAFYWVAILFTFALGTAAGDLIAERFDLGYLISAGIFFGVILLITGSHFWLKINKVLAFWLIYILTRPLGASLGDLLSQAKSDGGLGLGPTTTSIIFLAAILVLVVFLTITKKDVTPEEKVLADA
jgi:uncharacterized membrane-anchored protein